MNMEQLLLRETIEEGMEIASKHKHQMGRVFHDVSFCKNCDAILYIDKNKIRGTIGSDCTS